MGTFFSDRLRQLKWLMKHDQVSLRKSNSLITMAVWARLLASLFIGCISLAMLSSSLLPEAPLCASRESIGSLFAVAWLTV